MPQILSDECFLKHLDFAGLSLLSVVLVIPVHAVDLRKKTSEFVFIVFYHDWPLPVFKLLFDRDGFWHTNVLFSLTELLLIVSESSQDAANLLVLALLFWRYIWTQPTFRKGSRRSANQVFGCNVGRTAYLGVLIGKLNVFRLLYGCGRFSFAQLRLSTKRIVSIVILHHIDDLHLKRGVGKQYFWK